MFKSEEEHSWKELSPLPSVSASHSCTQISPCLTFAADSWYQAKNVLETTGFRKEVRKGEGWVNKELGIKTTQLFFWHWALLSLGSLCSSSVRNYFWFCRKRYSGKCNNKTCSSCFSFTNSFCSKCWNCLYLYPNKKDQYMTTKSFCGLFTWLWNTCKDLVPHGLVYSFAGAQFVLSYRFGDGKLSNEIAHETKMSRFAS